MRRLFNRKSTDLVGVDISSTAVKLIELSRDGDRYRVESYAVEPLPANADVEASGAGVEAIGETLSRAVRRAGVRSHSCALAVPSSAVITKIITMPMSLRDDELESQVMMEADQYIPFALDDVNLDFVVLGPSTRSPDANDVLLVASRRENVALRVDAVEMAGLTPVIVDVEAYAIEHTWPLLAAMLPKLTPASVVAVIDIGATMSSISVIAGGRLIYTREQPFGGKRLTEEIMRRYGMSYEEAGIAKKEGGLPDSYVPQVLEPFKDMLFQQVHRFLQLFFAASQHSSVEHVLLGGGCAAIPGIDEMIESRLGTPTSVVNLFGAMTLNPRINPQRISNDAPSLMVACGLALRSFD